jgi:hypothetical protein
LLLFSLEVARADARLFDEILDWLVVNDRLVSVQRLRNLCRDDADRALVEASVGWAGQWRSRGRLGSKEKSGPAATELLFRGLPSQPSRVDEIFQAHGWLKPTTGRSGKSQPPNVLAPINLAFRLRQILGVGARAEVVRFLLTDRTPRATVQIINESVAFAKRNVQEALTWLHSAGVVSALAVANEQRYGIDRKRWAALLATTPDKLPIHVAWPQLFHALRRLSRWLEDSSRDQLSDYLLASNARVLAEEITPALRYAGVAVEETRHTGADYWSDFVALVDAAISPLTGPSVSNILSNERRRTGRDQAVTTEPRSPESPASTGISQHQPEHSGQPKSGS